MNMKQIIILTLLAATLLLSACTTANDLDINNADPALLDLATCISDSGANFYGAYWCPHGEEQKDIFGAAQVNLPYTECDAKGTNGDPQACTEAGITSYPTWIFADGTVISGTQTFDTLAGITGCTWEG